MADYTFNWFPSAIDADEDVTPTEQTSQEGIMRRNAPSDTKEQSDSPNFLRNAIRSMANGFTGGPEEAKRVLGAGLTKDNVALQEEALQEYLSSLTPSGDDPLLLDEQGRPAESFRPIMRNAELTTPVGNTETVRPKPRPARVAEEPAASEPSSSNLLDFIGKGEGGYDSANRGTIGGNVIGSQRVASRGGKKVSELTVAEIQEYQSITDPNNEDRLFTVGKYQAIPDTFNQAVEGLGLSGDTVFTPEVQERVGMYLVSEKRPKVGQFLRGEGDVSTDAAMLELAKEFASIPVPTAIAKGTYGSWPKTDLVAGDSFYKDPKASSGNRAQHTVEETRAVLERARE